MEKRRLVPVASLKSPAGWDDLYVWWLMVTDMPPCHLLVQRIGSVKGFLPFAALWTLSNG
jgi:hypothetical protein